ncbi:hypothetical protein QQF64_016406 [Cirrhinus molitorella]|uniref:Secreted protein n=1 Tax=Cirrhinus molitorella TaxID=172907 RepID=A0ABR3LMQ3_9TELE
MRARARPAAVWRLSSQIMRDGAGWLAARVGRWEGTTGSEGQIPRTFTQDLRRSAGHNTTLGPCPKSHTSVLHGRFTSMEYTKHTMCSI